MSDAVFAGSIPELYDRFMVPLLFDSYARDLAQRLARLAPRNVLEIAAGTGAATRAIAAALPADARLLATDLHPPMLERAKARLAGDTRLSWQEADALALPFADARFDAVACQFGAMFFPDRVRGYREVRRVLQPGRPFLFSVWDHIAAIEFADTVGQAVMALFPADPPRFMERTPHGYHDLVLIRAELRDAGFGSVEIEARDDVSRAASARDVAVAFCQGTPLRTEIEQRDASRLEEATARATDALARAFGHGAIEGRMRAFIVTAQA